MKYALLRALAQRLSNQTKINRIERVADSVFSLDFGSQTHYFFDISRGQNFVYKNEKFPPKSYHAPFDIILAKLLTKVDIESISLEKTDKILTFFCLSKQGYKAQKIAVRFEFTATKANCIIVDETEKILAALHYENQTRLIKIGEPYSFPTPPPFTFEALEIDDLDSYMEDAYKCGVQKKIDLLKKQKSTVLDKKIEKLTQALHSTGEEDTLRHDAEQSLKTGDLLCANAHRILPHMNQLCVADFDGKQTVIVLPPFRNQRDILTYYYAKAKKLRQKADGVHIQKETLQEKITFLQAQRNAVLSAHDEESIKAYTPKVGRDDKDDANSDVFVLFYKNYKISVGKNKKGNEKLLKCSKANDFWFHLKDIPSAHVIIHTDRQRVGDDVIEFAAKTCVRFSGGERGLHHVDYTKRRDVSPTNGANVTYVNYRTITVAGE